MQHGMCREDAAAHMPCHMLSMLWYGYRLGTEFAGWGNKAPHALILHALLTMQIMLSNVWCVNNACQ